MISLKEKTERLLIKRGNGVERSKIMLVKSFETATKFYPNAKASFLADFISWHFANY